MDMEEFPSDYQSVSVKGDDRLSPDLVISGDLRGMFRRAAQRRDQITAAAAGEADRAHREANAVITPDQQVAMKDRYGNVVELQPKPGLRVTEFNGGLPVKPKDMTPSVVQKEITKPASPLPTKEEATSQSPGGKDCLEDKCSFTGSESLVQLFSHEAF